jgi:hypothetical protein
MQPRGEVLPDDKTEADKPRAVRIIGETIRAATDVDVRMFRHMPTGLIASVAQRAKSASRVRSQAGAIAKARAGANAGNVPTVEQARRYLFEAQRTLLAQSELIKTFYDYSYRLHVTKIVHDSGELWSSVFQAVTAAQCRDKDLVAALAAVDVVWKKLPAMAEDDAETPVAADVHADYVALRTVLGKVSTELKTIVTPINDELVKRSEAMERLAKDALAEASVALDHDFDETAIGAAFVTAEQGIKAIERLKVIPVAGSVAEAIGAFMTAGNTFLEKTATDAYRRHKVRNLRKDKVRYDKAVNRFKTEEGKEELAKYLAENYLEELKYNLKMLRPLVVGGNIAVAVATEATPAAAVGELVKYVWPQVEATLISVMTAIQMAEVRRIAGRVADMSADGLNFAENFKAELKGRAKADIAGYFVDPIGTISAATLQAAAQTIIGRVIDMVDLSPTTQGDTDAIYGLIEGELRKVFTPDS